MIRKQSKQRDIVLDYVKSMSGHASAEEIFAGINSENAKVSLATIYRNLNILAEMNEIKKIAHPMFGYVYDKTCDPHDHFYCLECHAFMDMDTDYRKDLDKEAEMKTGLRVYSHSLVYEGICEKCQKKHTH